ncbi:MAG: hypothetical protein ACLQO1_13010 [Steroidobacteraceae bacterium]
MPQIRDLIGLWQRSLVVWPDGTRDTTTCVRWLQGREMFVDLRQPASLPDFRHALSIDDLSMRDCACLATQQGFAGRLRFDGRHFEWARQIDFQPKSPLADAGSLEWQADVLVERGRDVEYIEHWHRDGAAATAPQGGVELREGDHGTHAVLLRVGSTFMFARNRTEPLPAQRTLQECVAAAPTVKVARQLVDCEISAGVVGAEGFRITASTLPFRRGRLLDHQLLHDSVMTLDQRSGGTGSARSWTIIDCEGDLGALHITR